MTEVLDRIPIKLELGEVMARLRNRSEMEPCVRGLLDAVREVARPKAAFAECYVDAKGPDWVSLGGQRFTSPVLRLNLEHEERAFAFVATCGREVDALTVPADDIMKAYCLDVIKRMLATSARDYLERYLLERYALGQASRMAPGELEDWPITQQRELFSLLGDTEKLVGVTLTESCLMVPVKSVSGIVFSTEVKFESCRLCVQRRCEGRRAPYSPALVQEYQARARALTE